jgi:RNA polymerase sigma factor (sigma-70 family)
MTELHPDTIVHHLRHLIGGIPAQALTDGQLLERFLANRDETAVEVLVRRYGPLVLGVCRRVLDNAHSAEDAFQATFLVLLRKASSLDRARPLGTWLSTVAYRLALRARANELRRRRCEEQAARRRPPYGRAASSSDLVVAVEEELHRLPEKHRAALVLCYLEGKTNEQAAQILGCPRGSMAARLVRARERLREYLARRGFVLPSAAIAAALTTAAGQAPVPLPLVDATVRAALWFAGEGAGRAGPVSAGVVALARGALRATVLDRVKIATALLLAVALLGTGATMLLWAGPSDRTAEAPSTKVRTKQTEAPGRGANAALSYRQAFIALRRGTKPLGEKKIRGECLTMSLDAQAREVVTKAAYALRMMQRGAALPRCDWAIDREGGIELSFTHADGARVLSSLACLRARLRFEEGHSAAAIDDVAAALTLARHVSRDGTLDGLRAAYHIEHLMSATLARYLPKLDAKALEGLRKRIDALPPRGSTATATIRMQETLLNWIVGEVKEASDRKSLLAFLSQICSESKEAPEKSRALGRAFLEECGGTAKGILEQAQQMRAPAAQLAKTLDLPPDQLAKQWQREEKKLASNPVFKVFAPVLQGIRIRQARADVRRALLSAAVAVQVDGKDALKKHPDPVVGGSFEYVGFKGGFELRSKWKLDEKLRAKWKLDERLTAPLTLTAGSRGK